MKYVHLAEAIGEDKAASIRHKTVTVVGLGGIGSAVSTLLVRSGVPVRIIEKGRVSDEDLDRLAMFSHDDVSKFKATQAKKHLNRINPDVMVKSFNEEINKETLFLMDADVIIDCTASEELTVMISKYCYRKKIPMVFGGVRDTKTIVVSYVPGDKPVHEQLRNIKHELTEGLIPAATYMAAGFLYIKALKILTGQKPKKGVVIYDTWKQQFEDKKGKKK